MNSFLEHLKSSCQANPGTIALPESSDERVLAAACQLIDNKSFKKVILFGDDPKQVRNVCDQHNLCFDDIEHGIVWANQQFPDLTELVSEQLSAYWRKRGLDRNPELATLASDSLAQAGYLLSSGHADVALAGATSTTSSVIRAAIRHVGLAPGCRTISGSFILVRQSASGEDESLLFADAGVVIEPTEIQLVDIASASANTYQQLFPSSKPKLAFLSFSTKGSADHAAAQKMANAARSFAKIHPDILSDGELQFDAAYVPEVGQRKCPNSPVAGQANCFIFPDLNAGNIAYKVAQRLGGFSAFGPILQGLRKPYSDLSRGASTLDIVASAYINRLRGLSKD